MSVDLGIYVHVPFCVSKCAYCSFYSLPASEEAMDRYTAKIEQEIRLRGVPEVRPVTSFYLGGGTPSLLGAGRVARILSAARESFSFETEAEITMEANPAEQLSSCFEKAADAGVNRISLGVQTSDAAELAMLGRRHTNADVLRTVAAARQAGICNLSVDLMLGIPGQTAESLEKSMEFVLSLKPQHVSAYLLKIEAGTPLAVSPMRNLIPDDDTAAELYEQMCRRMRREGFLHYEISNFAKPGFESRHNLRYWHCEEYLGFGPAAHSFDAGRRFYCRSDLEAFLKYPESVPDGTGGDLEEFLMLGLRLAEGISFTQAEDRFGVSMRPLQKKAEFFSEKGLCFINGDRVGLTESGMIVSNSVIYELISSLEGSA